MSAASGHTRTRGPAWFAKAQASVDVLYREIAKFGAVGAVAFVVDISVFNLMRAGVIGGDHGLAEKPLTAKTISVLAATVVAWLGNRYWTFRHRRRASRRREFTLFLLMNIGGLAIALACLGFSHYVLGLTSTLADNIAGNVVGLALGTLFRFWAYRQLVFTTKDEQKVILGEAAVATRAADESTDADSIDDAGTTDHADTTSHSADAGRPANQIRPVPAEDLPAPSAATITQAGPEDGERAGEDRDNAAPALVLNLRELDGLSSTRLD